ncbi:hypothetical protein NZK35_25540 [Stieleria sp. ICT_E10.1]|uniref:hypothetical protein n=1 Tax=Stieleria sedimenti TaxID=2976331 RepID=UPI00217FF721|nr:hypothetical protein [Stieleria sedimenti]MCS7470025.1 hypothetical protein [Stieleria sedimenti]
MHTPDLSEFNFTITVDDVATAIKKVNAYSTEQRIRRFDDVAAKQGNVMGAAVQLGSLKVPMELVEESLYVLLVLFELFEAVAPTMPPVSQETVQDSFDKYAAMIRFYDEESPRETQRLSQAQWKKFPEHAVLAFVVNHLKEKLIGINRETELVRQCCMVMTQSFVSTYVKSRGT